MLDTAADLQGLSGVHSSTSRGCFGSKVGQCKIRQVVLSLYAGVWKMWALRAAFWVFASAVMLFFHNMCFLAFLSAGEEGVVFSHSVETSHVRAEPFQDLRWVCVGVCVRERESILAQWILLVVIFQVCCNIYELCALVYWDNNTTNNIWEKCIKFSAAKLANRLFLRHMVFS